MKASTGVSPRKTAKRASRTPSPWRVKIEKDDAQSILRWLNRLVSVHPLVRSALGSHQSTNQSSIITSIHDLTQDLYLLLIQKGRFDHYIVSRMTDSEIEREIFQIELTNLLIGNLRRRRPENYRIARRVSNVLASDENFRRFKVRDGWDRARYRQAADAVYGLREWDNSKVVKDSGTFSELINSIPMRMRDRRRTGCTGEAQVIVSNNELAELIVEIFEAIDSPAPLRVLRQLALSKLPLYDPVMTSIDEEVGDESYGRFYRDSFASSQPSPEQLVLEDEDELEARRQASFFLDHLNKMMRSNTTRTERICRILWHCFFDPEEPSQIEIAEMVGISDSSVSDYRRKLETEMSTLRFSPEHLRSFAEELDDQLRWRLSLPERENRSHYPETDVDWSKYEYERATTSKSFVIN